MDTSFETLQQAGLSLSQAEVYEALLTYGEQTAGALTKKISQKRGMVYKSLFELAEMGLAEKREQKGQTTLFSPKHPSILLDMVEKRARDFKNAETILEGFLPVLVSKFNISSGGPGIRVYEGEEAISKVLDDSLTAKSVIRSYVDVEAVEKTIKEVNARYMKKREKLQITKKLLVADNVFTRDLYAKEKSLITDVRVIPAASVPFEVSMQIYDNKVSYLTLLPKMSIGVIIEDAHIFNMHAFLFDVLYEKAEKIA